MSLSTLTSQCVELARRLVKLLLFVGFARGDEQRYFALRGRAMEVLVKKGLYEPEDLANLALFVQPGDTVVDVGAHFGGYTERFSDLVGPHGRVHAVEPIGQCAEYLETLVSRHPGITVHRCAVSDREVRGATLSIPRLFGFIPEPALASLSFNSPAPDGTHIVVTTLDHIMAKEVRISFIKLDIEGGEFAALAGAQAIIERDRPTIQIEQNTPHESWLELLAFCERFTYRPIQIRDGICHELQNRRRYADIISSSCHANCQLNRDTHSLR